MHLGPSCVSVDGRALRSATLDAEVARIQGAVQVAMSAHRCAQVLVDDFGHAMRQDAGYAFQAALRALVVDGADSERVGALLVTRLNDPVRVRKQRGSPLTAVARYMFPPWFPLEVFEATALAMARTPTELEMFCGSNPAILSRLAGGGGIASAREYCADALATWLADLTPLDLKRLAQLCGGPQPNDDDDDRLAPLLSRSSQTRLITALDSDRTCALVIGGWPGSLVESAERLAMRIGNEERPLWVDRYFGPYPQQLCDFLSRLLVSLGPRRMRLLGTSRGIADLTPQAIQLLRGRAAALSHQGFLVEWRIADDDDYVALHGRQLHLTQNGNAFGIPPVDRVLGAVPIGNETDSIIIAPDTDGLEAAWLRATAFIEP